GQDTFPSIVFDQVEKVGGWGGAPVRWKIPASINGALTKLFGSHSVKLGADYRRMGVALGNTISEGPNGVPALGGSFEFDNLFTSRNGAAGTGHEIASLLLGLPKSGVAHPDLGAGEW